MSTLDAFLRGAACQAVLDFDAAQRALALALARSRVADHARLEDISDPKVRRAAQDVQRAYVTVQRHTRGTNRVLVIRSVKLLSNTPSMEGESQSVRKDKLEAALRWGSDA